MYDELIRDFWRVLQRSRVPHKSGEGLCQCSTEELIRRSPDPKRMRAFIMISVFIDQMMYTHFRHLYVDFRYRFRFPKLYSHISSALMMNAGWLVYSRRGYDREMDWAVAQSVADTLFGSVFDFLGDIDEMSVDRFVDVAEREIPDEFEEPSAIKFAAMLSAAYVKWTQDVATAAPAPPTQMSLFD